MHLSLLQMICNYPISSLYSVSLNQTPFCLCDVKSDELKDHGTLRNFRYIKMQYKAFIEKEKGKM